MMQRPFMLVPLVSVVLLAAGCGSSPEPRFFTLAPVATSGQAVNPGVTGLIMVEAVTVPDVLRRTNIVRGVGQNAVDIAQFDRWSEPLDRNLGHALIAHLHRRFPNAQVVDRTSRFVSDPRWTIRVRVTQFMSDATGTSRLAATWEVENAGSPPPVVRSREFSAPVSGTQASDVVSAMSELAAQLGDAIGETIGNQ